MTSDQVDTIVSNVTKAVREAVAASIPQEWYPGNQPPQTVADVLVNIYSYPMVAWFDGVSYQVYILSPDKPKPDIFNTFSVEPANVWGWTTLPEFRYP